MKEEMQKTYIINLNKILAIITKQNVLLTPYIYSGLGW